MKDPEKTTDEKNEIRTLFKLHKLRAQKLYEIMIKDPDVLKVIFDKQQNQPLPKLSVGEIFYSRQVWFYNLTVMLHCKSQDRNNISHYTWLETESGRGANEVASCVIDFLQKLDKYLSSHPNKKYTLHLFSDSCASQNKNTILLACLMKFLEESSNFIKIRHFFPIRGHSFMPADRVFGRVEREYRKKEEIISPEEYRTILRNTGTVLSGGKDFFFLIFKKQNRTKI